MNDLISRQAAIDAIEEMQIPIMRSIFPEEQFVFKGMSEALSAIKDLPSAQPERKRGKWIDDGDPFMWVCDVCGYRVKRYNNTRYCPNCGAEMRGDADE